MHQTPIQKTTMFVPPDRLTKNEPESTTVFFLSFSRRTGPHRQQLCPTAMKHNPKQQEESFLPTHETKEERKRKKCSSEYERVDGDDSS